MLPACIKSKECGVINNESVPGLYGGTHWVAYYNDPANSVVEFFDPFGLFPAREIEWYLRSSKKVIEYNATAIQNNNSTLCGWFCYYFLILKHKGKRFIDIITEFSMDTRKNDHLLRQKISTAEI